MYFLVALAASIISGALWFFFKDRKNLHLDVLTITFSAATLMWLIDCIFSAAGGEGFLTFDDPVDGWIALWTVLGGIFFWVVFSFIANNKQKTIA